MVNSWILALFASLAGVSGTVGATTLTEKQLAAHFHETGNHVEDTALLPAWAKRGGKDTVRTGWNISFDTVPGYYGATKDTGSSTSHVHSLSGVKSGSASSLPPYYALAYIMRIA